jgi:hypothetical protein
MAASFLLEGGGCSPSELRRFYSKRRAVLVDVFRDSTMAAYAKQMGFGLWVASGLYDDVAGLQGLCGVKDYFGKVGEMHGSRATATNGKIEIRLHASEYRRWMLVQGRERGHWEAQCAQY